MYQDINIRQDLSLADSLSDDNLSIEVILYEDIEGGHKYEFPDRANVIHSIPSE